MSDCEWCGKEIEGVWPEGYGLFCSWEHYDADNNSWIKESNED